MRRWVVALVLLLCLAACGGGAEEVEQGRGLFWEASGIQEDEVLLTVDGREVPAWRYLYWLTLACDGAQERYEAAGLPLDWTAPLPGGTLSDYVKDQALADTALYAVVENWAALYGCAGPQTDPDGAWAARAAEHGGEAAYLEALADRGLDRAREEELAAVGRLYGVLWELYGTPGSPLAPTEEALAAFARERRELTVDRVLVSAGTDRETARKRAAELFSQLNGAADQAAAFSALAQAGDDPAGPRTLTLGDGTLDPVLEDAAEALAPGQVSGVLESGEGFSILRRLEDDPAELRADYFDHLLENAAAGAAVRLTEAYEKLDPAAFADALSRARQAAGEG